MVKRMKKVKTNAQASLGVRTRAKTMGLKKSSSFISASKIKVDIITAKGDDGCYLQLRSRRVERRRAPLRKKAKKNKKDDYGEIEDGSVGDNELQLENKERNTRERTPSSLIDGSGPNIVKTPTSSNKAATNVNPIKKVQNVRRMLQISQDWDPRMLGAKKIDEFFAIQEKKNIERFIEKYNFDPVNEKPLKGRYEWVKLKP
ncbi:cyclin-dependent kinase inhibitor 4 [Phtheirospermum japonicum]|uniref:Cyclin-dependent kinase inhibitor n=1 Tax=Phtheirospermum japonicum TaxID=374723 RepID=A0A830CA42_9LAMI|nr:cyclin-dependent kinase inhibitor 4 [Phtheirospermum japonicum]